MKTVGDKTEAAKRAYLENREAMLARLKEIEAQAQQEGCSRVWIFLDASFMTVDKDGQKQIVDRLSNGFGFDLEPSDAAAEAAPDPGVESLSMPDDQHLNSEPAGGLLDGPGSEYLSDA